MSTQREIKFRALRDDMGDCTWVYGMLIYNYEHEPRIQENTQKFLFTTCLKGTEGQYTGLRDKNGKEIYEGDVVVFDVVQGTGPNEQSAPKNVKGVVDWKPHGLGYGDWRECYTTNVKVIGNIHENPELIK